jgi:hypothetical protein
MVICSLRCLILSEQACGTFVDCKPSALYGILWESDPRGQRRGKPALVRAEKMVQIPVGEWQIAGVAAGVVLAAGAAFWLLHRKRPTLDELEQQRREVLLSFGRIVDGMLLDGFQVAAEDGTTRDMLLYQYEISGVTYECSQDITTLAEVIALAEVKLGMPCSIRYQPGIPENSILIAERWSGLRDGVPVMWISPTDPSKRGAQPQP